MQSAYAAFQERFEQITQRAVAQIREQLPGYRQMPTERVMELMRSALEPFSMDLRETPPHHFFDYWRDVSRLRATQGFPMESVQAALDIGTATIIDEVKAVLAGQPEQQLAFVEQASLIIRTGVAALYTGYRDAQAEVIQAQQSALQELSSPIIPVYTGILVLPLVGSIDSQRATQIMEGLLEGINEHQADVVILDITGVPLVDTGVANYLLQAARAARLLGSHVVLVGISAEIAQTIVQLGVDLSDITIRANLQSGIEYALEMLGLAVQPIQI